MIGTHPEDRILPELSSDFQSLFLVDKQGMTGKKHQYTSIPYKSIDYFSKETAGHFDLDAEINVWIKSRKEPIVLEFRKDTHIHDVFKVLSHYALAS